MRNKFGRDFQVIFLSPSDLEINYYNFGKAGRFPILEMASRKHFLEALRVLTSQNFFQFFGTVVALCVAFKNPLIDHKRPQLLKI